jgi:Glycosyltransferase family 87
MMERSDPPTGIGGTHPARPASTPGGTTREWWAEVWPMFLVYPAILLVMAFQSGLPWRPLGEPPRYLGVVNDILAGRIPYRDLPLEYPPLALVSWIVPRLVSGDEVFRYAWLLAVQNAALGAGVAACLAWLARRGWSADGVAAVLAIGALLLLGVAHVVVWLFDLVPALLVGLALVAVAVRRPTAAGLLLGLGTLVKVYPSVLVPVLLLGYLAAGDRRAAVRLLAGTAGVVALVMVPATLIAGEGAWSFLDYQAQRGVQLESVPGSLAMLAALLGGPEATVYHGFGAWQVGGPLARAFTPLMPGVLIAGVGLVLASTVVRLRRDVGIEGRVRQASLVACATAAIVAVMVANKVLSPQFLIWLLPVAPLLPRPQALLAAGTSLLTLGLLGDDYIGLMQQRPEMVWLLTLRNALLVALLAWLVVDGLRSPRTSRSGPAPGLS